MKLFTTLFGRRQSRQRSPQGFATPSHQTFLLEPILTPSGIIDGVDDAPAVTDLPLLDDVGEADVDFDQSFDATPLPETEVLETELEEVAFVTDLSADLADAPSFQFESGYFTMGDSGEVTIDYLFDGGKYQGELAIFSLEGMEGLEPGSEAFIQEAANRALSDSELGHVVISDKTDGARFSGELGERDWNSGDYQGAQTFEMRAGDRFGVMLVPNGQVEAVADNPGLGGAKTPLFSLATANPDDGLQLGQIADVTGDGNTFVFEDLRVDGRSDQDYNDLIFQIRGATGETALVDNLIDPELEWRDGDLGEGLMQYAKEYINADVSSIGVPQDVEVAVADQPLIGIIDTGFSSDNPDIDYSRITLGSDRVDGDANPLLAAGEGNEHGTHILCLIAAEQDNGIGIDGVNDDAPVWLGRTIGSGEWADSLVEFVEHYRDTDQPNAVVNLSLDLTQVNPDGSVTTRYELTPAERAAVDYARQHEIILVVSAGNDSDVMSALGQASQEFDNIITVGSAERANAAFSTAEAYERADYSSYGQGLDILASGGTTENPILSTVGNSVGSLAGTSVATAKVTGAISQVWAANPELNYLQVIDLIKSTATDLQENNWDTETGAGLLNLAAAMTMARATTPEVLTDIPATLIPESWSGEGITTPTERAVNFIYPIQNESFNGTVAPIPAPYNGVSYRRSPRLDDRWGQYIAAGSSTNLNFDAWTYGERVSDWWMGTPDELWYRVSGTNYWVPSAYIYGYPGSRPPVLKPAATTPEPQPTPTPVPVPNVPIDSGSADYRDGRRNPFAYNPALIGQCTWFAYGRMQETGLMPPRAISNAKFRSHAYKWAQDARSLGLPVNSKPTPGARGLVIWPPGVQGAHRRYGHVAFLEKVLPDGSIRISQSNWAGNKSPHERIMPPAQYAGLQFVPLEKAQVGTPTAQAPGNPGSSRAYLVKPGDTLWAIAQRELGSGHRWREIMKTENGGTFTEAEARLLQPNKYVYLPVSYRRGRGTPVTSTPTTTPRTSNINWVNFSGTVGPNIGVNLRHSPRHSDRSNRNEPYGKRLEFDAWTTGETITDLWLGTPDSRWFKVKGTNLWVPSAYIWGNPPSSNSGNNEQPPVATDLPDRRWPSGRFKIVSSADSRFDEAKSVLPDEGSGVHGGKRINPFQMALEQAKKLTFYTGANIFEATGRPNAARHMRHYLNNSGQDLNIDVDLLLLQISGLNSVFRQGVSDAVSQINGYISSSDDTSDISLDIGTSWNLNERYYIGSEQSEDWYYASGGIYYRFTSSVDVRFNSDANPTINMRTQMHIFDRYNWDGGKAVTIGGIEITDATLGELHKVGIAQEYNLLGSSGDVVTRWNYPDGYPSIVVDPPFPIRLRA